MVVVEELSDDNDEAPTVNPDGSCTSDAQATKAKAKARAEVEEQAAAAKAKAAQKAAAAQARAEKKADAKARREGGKDRSHLDDANVFINVYDITPRLNRWLRCCCAQWGIYHTGVEVHGREFAFGGHDAETTGVFCAKPNAIQGAKFFERVPIGHTNLNPPELRQQIAALATEWSGNSYDLLKRNCNHFAVDLCEDLTGESGPRYINRCAQSSTVRCIFTACVKPLIRCLDRCTIWNRGVSYTEDEASGDSGDEYCIKGARGMNEVLVEAATMQKEKANQYFRSGEYHEAAKIYMQALSLIQSLSRLDDELDNDLLVMKQAREVCKALLLNIAACNLKAQDWDRAIVCCNQVLQWDAESSKALFRRGVALSKTGDFDKALVDLQKALSLTDQSDVSTRKHIQQEIDAVQRECGSATEPAPAADL